MLERNMKNGEVDTKDKKILTNNKMGKLSATQTDGYSDTQVNDSGQHVDDEVLDLEEYLGTKKQLVVKEVDLQNNNSNKDDLEKSLQGFVEGDGELTDEELEIRNDLESDLVADPADSQHKKMGDEIVEGDFVSVGLESQKSQVSAGEEEGKEKKIEGREASISGEDIVTKSEVVDLAKYEKLKEKMKSAKEMLKEKKDLLDRLKSQAEKLNDKIGILGKNAGMIDSLQSELQDAEKKVVEAREEIAVVRDEINALKSENTTSPKELLTEVIGKRTSQTFIVDIQNVIKEISPDMELEEAGDIANLIMDGFFTKIKEEFSYKEANKVFALAFRKFNATIGSEFVVKFDEREGFVLEIPEISKELNKLIINADNSEDNLENKGTVVEGADDYNINNLTKAA
jgi:hypothetical protein